MFVTIITDGQHTIDGTIPVTRTHQGKAKTRLHDKLNYTTCTTR